MPASAPLQLRIAYWYADHRSAFLRLRAGVVVMLFFLGLVAVGLAWWFGSTLSQQLRSVGDEAEANAGTYTDFISSRAPQQVTVSSVSSLPGAEDSTADYFVTIQNSNQLWGVSVLSYQFNIGGAVETGTSFVLPGQETYIFARGAANVPSSFAVTGMQWQRTRPGLPDLRQNFVVKKLQYTPQLTVKGSTTPLTLSRVTAEIENETVQDFWEVPFVVVAIGSGGNIVGIRSVTVPQMASFGTATLEATWVGVLPGVKDVRVIPQVNLYDPAVHRAPADVPGEAH